MLRYMLIPLLGAALAACGDLPKPFKPDEKSTRTWTEPGSGVWGSVLVQPIEGVPAALAAALADETVEALLVREVPASTHAASRASITLAGRIGAVGGTLHWTLVAPGGETVLRFQEPRPDGPWKELTAPALSAVATRAAERVSAALEPPAYRPGGAPTTLPVVLTGVHGAPGDGGATLTRAMRRSLGRAGIAIADIADEETFLVQGRVRVDESSTDQRGTLVAIAWTVLHPDGTRIGTVTQSNRVAPEQLAGSWGPLADAVARAGAPGIAELLSRAAAPEAPATRFAEPLPPAATPEAPRAAPLAVPIASRATMAAPIAPSAIVEALIASLARVEAPIALLVTADARLAGPAAVEAPIALSITVP